MTLVEDIFVVEASKRTPFVEFDKNLGKLTIKGKSLPEYSYAFFGKIFDAVDDYLLHVPKNTTINFQFEYINSISTKMIMQLIKKFERLVSLGQKVEINWFYDEEDDIVFELGEVYKADTNIPFTILKIHD